MIRMGAWQRGQQWTEITEVSVLVAAAAKYTSELQCVCGPELRLKGLRRGLQDRRQRQALSSDGPSRSRKLVGQTDQSEPAAREGNTRKEGNSQSTREECRIDGTYLTRLSSYRLNRKP